MAAPDTADLVVVTFTLESGDWGCSPYVPSNIELGEN